jgi:ribosomal protein L12E/L44/L45/RPP1/RPP2
MEKMGVLGIPVHHLLFSSIVISSLAKALSQRPVEELNAMLEAARTVDDDARAAAQRSKFEVEVIEEALSSAQESPSPRSPVATAASASNRPTPQEVRDMVLRIVGELGPVPPKSIKEAIGDESINVYNPLGRLVKEGKLIREDGIYDVPRVSFNGQHLNGAPTAAQQTSSRPMYAPEGGMKVG